MSGTYRIARVFGFDDLRKGDTVFVARVHEQDFPRAGVRYNEAQPVPFTTNQSHEAREHGWCGNTSGTDVFAIGRAVITTVIGTVPEGTDIFGREHEAYVRIRVRLDDSAPDTFAEVDDDLGAPQIVRIIADDPNDEEAE